MVGSEERNFFCTISKLFILITYGPEILRNAL